MAPDATHARRRADASPPLGEGRPPWGRRARRIAGRTLVGLLILLLVGAVTQAGLEWRDPGAHPAPGELVDASHEDQLERSEDADAQLTQFVRMLRAVQAAARVGALRVYHQFATQIADLPETHHRSVRAQMATPGYVAAVITDNLAVRETSEHVRALGDLGDTPVRSLAAGAAPDVDLHRQLPRAGRAVHQRRVSRQRGRRPLDDPQPAAPHRPGERHDRGARRHARRLTPTAHASPPTRGCRDSVVTVR